MTRRGVARRALMSHVFILHSMCEIAHVGGGRHFHLFRAAQTANATRINIQRLSRTVLEIFSRLCERIEIRGKKERGRSIGKDCRFNGFLKASVDADDLSSFLRAQVPTDIAAVRDDSTERGSRFKQLSLPKYFYSRKAVHGLSKDEQHFPVHA